MIKIVKLDEESTVKVPNSVVNKISLRNYIDQKNNNLHKINYNFSNFIKIKNCLSKRVAPDLTSVSRCARKYVYDHDVKYGAKCKNKK